MGMTVETVRLSGREAESGILERFLASGVPAVAGASIEGEPGTGKTVLWQTACREARRNGFRVLTARPAESEAKYSFAGLRDLFEPVPADIVRQLPPPQRAALEAALLLTPKKSRRVEHHAVCAAVLNCFRLLVDVDPLCVAVDDLQWLDRPTARLLAFSFRRATSGRVRLLATYRTGCPPGPAGFSRDWFPDGHFTTVVLGPLDAPVLRAMLARRLDHALPPPTLSRVVRTAAGNPLYALELGRAVVDCTTVLEPGTPLPLTERILVLLRRRLAGLPTSSLHALRLAAALHRPSLAVVTRALPDARASLSAASAAGVVELDHDRIHFSHPLLATVIYRDTPEPRRRWIHRRLAGAVIDIEERARHLALAGGGPDPGTAAALEQAAAAATGRGAPDAGAELAELAIRMTPPTRRRDRWRRTLDAADRHFETGDLPRARALLEHVSAEDLPDGSRSDVLSRLAAIAGYSGDLHHCMALLQQAADAAGDDAGRRCVSEQLLTSAEICAGDFAKAHERALGTLEVAEDLRDPRLLIFSLCNAGFTTFVLGGGVPNDLLDRAVELEEWADPLLAERHPRFLRGAVLRFADQLESARRDLETCLARFTEAGEYAKLPTIAWHLSELECWAGNWDLADRLATVATDNASQSGSDLALAYALYSRATVDAHRGRVATARAAAEEGLLLAGKAGDRTSLMLHLSALGFLELSLENPSSANQPLSRLRELRQVTGIEEPGVLRCLPDEIETLVALDELADAERLLDRFESRARTMGRPWALATAARCRSLVHAARGELDAADRALGESLHHHVLLGQPFELGRTLLVDGVIKRRLKKKLAPRESFQKALEIFTQLGATLWEERARRELERTAVRRVAPTDLSPMERRVASLAAAGHTNREIAAALSLRPKTVEANLGRVYRKLDVRSRTELARVWLAPPQRASPTAPISPQGSPAFLRIAGD